MWMIKVPTDLHYFSSSKKSNTDQRFYKYSSFFFCDISNNDVFKNATHDRSITK